MNFISKAVVFAISIAGVSTSALAIGVPGKPVPEPGSLALVGVAVAALVAISRKRK